MASRTGNPIPSSLFPCKKCLLVVCRKYPNSAFRLKESAASDPDDTLLILDKERIINEKIVKKMTPGCRYCEGYYHHVIGH